MCLPEENGVIRKPRSIPDYAPLLRTQILANINVFADPCISSALFSRRVVRGMNTLNGPYGALERPMLCLDEGPVQQPFSGILSSLGLFRIEKVIHVFIFGGGLSVVVL